MQEQIDLWRNEKTTYEYAGGKESETLEELLNRLVEDKLLTEDERATLEETGKVEIGNRTIVYGKTLVQAFKDEEIKIGDFVTNYNDTLKNSSATVTLLPEETGYEENQTYKLDKSTTWRVLGLSEDGKNLVITTGMPIKRDGDDAYLYLNGAEGWYNAGMLQEGNILDRICSIYSGKYAKETRSMRMEDINNALGIEIDEESKKAYKVSESGEKTEIGSEFLSFNCEDCIFKSGDRAPENYLKEKYPQKYASLTTRRVGENMLDVYKLKCGYALFATNSNIIDPSSKLYEIIFKGTENGGTKESENGKNSYWLAGSGCSVNKENGVGALGGDCVAVSACIKGQDSFLMNGFMIRYAFGVKPIVILKSDTLVGDLEFSEEGQADEWETYVPQGLRDEFEGGLVEE